MKVYEIYDDTNEKVLNILKTGITENMFDNKKLSLNYLYKYKNNPGNLFYVLKNGRYKKGCYFVVVDENDNYLASAGWYSYNHNTALLLTRMLVVPTLRGSYILAKTVLQKMIDQSSNHKNRWLTFNEYNLTLYKWFERVHEGKRGALFNNWPEIYSKFKPIGTKQINGTLQYVVELKNE
jgi:hypothetical protein